MQVAPVGPDEDSDTARTPRGTAIEAEGDDDGGDVSPPPPPSRKLVRQGSSDLRLVRHVLSINALCSLFS